MLQTNSISTVATHEREQFHIGKRTPRKKFLWALAAFIALSQCLALFNLGAVDTLNLAEHTWIYWATDKFSRLTKAPDVVLLGSSLVLTPVNLADAQILGKTLDGSQHHESAYFASLINKLTGRRIQTFNFALPGEMPSDAYLITKFLLRGAKKPQMIVYGVGPRDFMDNLLTGPTATDPYHYFSRTDNRIPDEAFVGRSWGERIDRFLGRIIYPYGNRELLAQRFDATMRYLVTRLLPKSLRDRQLSSRQIHHLLPNYHPMSIATGECLFHPLPEEIGNGFKDNIDEYRKRYGTLKWQTFVSQLTFLANFLDLARKQRSEAVIVAMPITKVNRSLISPLAWNAYKRSLRVITMSKGARFIDLEESKQFNDSDFGDTIHLNTIGGIKMVQLIVADILQAHDEETIEQASFRPEEKAAL